MDIKRNTMWLEKGTQILCIGIMLLSIGVSIRSLVRYNNLFETNLLHVSINYQIYALIYIAQTILLCVINILAVKLMHNTHKQLNFSNGNFYIIVSLSFSLMFYSLLTNINSFLNIEEKYTNVLNSENMGNTIILTAGSVLGVLSAIYSKSQKIKEENDYTI